MLRYIRLLALLSVAGAIFVTACVESEKKRTTKKVDVSQAQIYQTDITKPRIRVSVFTPPELRASVAGRMFIEIDDGTMRYGFTSSVFAADSADTSGRLYSPWVNTPDSGQVSLKFRVVDDAGSNIVSDMVEMGLAPNQFWQVEIGVYSEDPCPGLPGAALCRSYSLPRSVQMVESDKLFMIWSSSPLAEPQEDSQGSLE